MGEEVVYFNDSTPREYTNNQYKYIFEINGNIDYFEGVETIYKDDEKLYTLKCHGGIIKR